MHDMFGTVDYVVFAGIMALVVPVQLCMVLVRESGIRGLVVGGLVGSVVARVTILLLNYVFGASKVLIDAVDLELRQFNHANVFINFESEGQLYVMEKELEDKLAEVIKYCKDIKIKNVIKNMEEYEKVIKNMEEHGLEILRQLALYVKRHYTEVICHSDMVHRLFMMSDTQGSITAGELCAMSLLDPTCFLTRYFDPEFHVFGDVWPRAPQESILQQLYVASPVNMRVQKQGNTWEVCVCDTMRHCHDGSIPRFRLSHRARHKAGEQPCELEGVGPVQAHLGAERPKPT